jgi:23S rRNA (guanosine2251-2'-O)-methyltransferase
MSEASGRGDGRSPAPARLSVNEASGRGDGGSPRHRFITVYGRMPVIEVLSDPNLEVDKVVVAEGAGGANLERIRGLARDRGVPVRPATAQRVKLLAGNGRHDQGVIADVVAPRMGVLTDVLEGRTPPTIVVLDGVSNPSNVGMIIRSAVAAGIDGVVLPRVGSPSVDPMVIKASAGVAFRAPILHCRTAVDGLEALRGKGYRIYGLARAAARPLFGEDFPPRTVFVLGNETDGISAAVAPLVDEWISIPMAGGVDSLNVSSAAAVVCFEVARRRLIDP